MANYYPKSRNHKTGPNWAVSRPAINAKKNMQRDTDAETRKKPDSSYPPPPPPSFILPPGGTLKLVSVYRGYVETWFSVRHSEFWFFFDKQDALSHRAYFTIFYKDTEIKLTAIRKIVQFCSSYTYFHYCFIHSPRPYTQVGH